MKRAFNLLWVNLSIFVGILILLEIVSSVILDIKDVTFVLKRKNEPRVNLENYERYEWAKEHFKEFASLDVKYSSFSGWRSKFFNGKTINIDSNGIRATIPFYTQSNNTISTIWMGGSTVWGFGVNDENTIPSLFSNLGNSKYSVSNFGESGYSAFQSSVFLNKSLIVNEARPDLVISYDGVNNSPSFLPQLLVHPKELGIESVMKGVEKRTKFRLLSLNSLRWILGRVRNKFEKFLSKSEDCYVIKPYRHLESAKELLESWLIMKRNCLDIGAQFVCILQPNKFVGRPNLTNLNSAAYPQFSKQSYEYYKYVFQLLKTDKYKTLNENFIDLSQVLNGIPNVYVDYCHLSPQGNKIIASEVISILNATKN
jgi:hypothetical protein